MEERAIAAARALAEHYMTRSGGELIDPRLLVRVATAAFLAGSGVPTDAAVAAVERLVARGLVSPVSANPMYHGIPWLVAGPVSGVPYYAGG